MTDMDRDENERRKKNLEQLIEAQSPSTEEEIKELEKIKQEASGHQVWEIEQTLPTDEEIKEMTRKAVEKPSGPHTWKKLDE